jgi:hypothetical protein
MEKALSRTPGTQLGQFGFLASQDLALGLLAEVALSFAVQLPHAFSLTDVEHAGISIDHSLKTCSAQGG